MSNIRTTNFRKNMLLESLLSELSADLCSAEERLLSAYRNKPMKYPLVLVMGPLRSGTTLFMQWLANMGIIAYPSNLLSRFYYAPIIGAKIQLLLTDPHYNFRDELYEFTTIIDFTSENGKTKGVLAPNEFWYFWRRFLSDPTCDVWLDDELRRSMDTHTMLAELIGVMDVFQKPFVAKGMLFNYNIPFLDSILEKVVFVQIERALADNAASVLGARMHQLGNESTWYSFKIPEYDELAELDPVSQAVGQVCAVNRAVTAGMGKVPESRRMYVQYEDFCREPARTFHEIVDRLGLPMRDYIGPRRFHASRVAEGARTDAIKRAIAEIGLRYG